MMNLVLRKEHAKIVLPASRGVLIHAREVAICQHEKTFKLIRSPRWPKQAVGKPYLVKKCNYGVGETSPFRSKKRVLKITSLLKY
jgi:hypothetical protein